MNESPTGGESSSTGLSNQPTGQEQIQNKPAESQNQEAISGEQSQGTASTDTAKPNTNTNSENGGSQNDDDGLAKFAKSQGFDPDNLTDGERKALKLAHDNQKAYRNSSNEKKVTDTAQELNPASENESEDEAFRREFRQYKYEQKSDKFWSEDGRDKTLEPAMVQILNEKKEQYGAAYAANLSQDLPTLYDLARLKSGALQGPDTEAIRREERESIRKQQMGGGEQQHASSSQASSPEKIDRDWLSTKYDPSNPEHRKLVDEAVANGDLV